jgi:ACR3 family arsenite efflux pump ArsB
VLLHETPYVSNRFPLTFLIGTLSAADIDTAAAMTFTTTSTNFKIVNNNELRTNRSITTTGLSVDP